MPRMKAKTYDFGISIPETFRDVVEDTLVTPLEEININTENMIPELKRIRFANELILGEEVDVPED